MQTSESQTRNQIVAIVSDSVDCAVGLKECLGEERAALTSRSAEALTEAVQSKRALLEKLQQLESERNRISEAAGFSAGSTQMDDLVVWCDDDSIIANRWQHLLQVASECNDLNAANGAIIRVTKQHVETSLAILRNGDAESESYNPAGSEYRELGQRTLAEA